jgi:hypothetical protein
VVHSPAAQPAIHTPRGGGHDPEGEKGHDEVGGLRGVVVGRTLRLDACFFLCGLPPAFTPTSTAPWRRRQCTSSGLRSRRSTSRGLWPVRRS